MVKFIVEISQNFVAFSEYMNFNNFDILNLPFFVVKFMYFEKATKFCKISTIDLFYDYTVKFTSSSVMGMVSVHFVEAWPILAGEMITRQPMSWDK